jgi:hypothetical protein
MERSPNTIVIHEHSYLLAWVGGSAAHLVAGARPEEPARSIGDSEPSASNLTFAERELAGACWSLRTLCGRDGWSMCPTDASDATREPAYAPSCRRCLRLLDALFDQPEPDDRLPWNVIRCIEELEQWGCFMIDDVPLLQMTLLRDRVRAEARRRGWQFTSRASDQRLIGASENSLSPARRDIVERDARERMSGIGADATDAPGQPRPSWTFRW